MASETGWKRNVCDGSSKHCVGIAFVKEDDPKAQSVWHDRIYITKDGEEMHYFFCESCADEFDKIISKHDTDIQEFIEIRGA